MCVLLKTAWGLGDGRLLVLELGVGATGRTSSPPPGQRTSSVPTPTAWLVLGHPCCRMGKGATIRGCLGP